MPVTDVLKFKKQYHLLGSMQINWNSHVLLVGSEMVRLLWKTVWQFLKDTSTTRMFHSILRCLPQEPMFIQRLVLEWPGQPYFYQPQAGKNPQCVKG